MNYINPVSYTHLDVYKRQPIGKVDFDLDKIVENFKAFMDQIIRLKPASSKGQYLRTVAVSYTHLDVYKRQLYNCSRS